jgi:3D (Asp-Asp-Asp) domain-containing protein
LAIGVRSCSVLGKLVIVVAALGASGPLGTARADTSKLAKEGVAPAPRAPLQLRDTRCCGYPLAEELGFALRFYWLALEEDFDEPDEIDYADPDEVGLYTREGFFIAAVPEKFAWHLRMEGSGLMADGRVLNTHGKCKHGFGTCFQTVDPKVHPYGRGAGQRPLVPFKSVAVDPRVVPIGEPIYIPEFDGMRLPDGSLHDGCVRADDTGGGIKQRKMDFFVVTYGNFRFLLSELWGVSFMTPHLESPRCAYLRDPA